jgi:hypothetical protein
MFFEIREEGRVPIANVLHACPVPFTGLAYLQGNLGPTFPFDADEIHAHKGEYPTEVNASFMCCLGRSRPVKSSKFFLV